MTRAVAAFQSCTVDFADSLRAWSAATNTLVISGPAANALSLSPKTFLYASGPARATSRTWNVSVVCQDCLPWASGIFPAFSSAGAAATNSLQFFGMATPASWNALLEIHSHCGEWMLTGTQ